MSGLSAAQLKEEGNRHFRAGDYTGADGFYSKAIIKDPKNAQLYTNRAFARVKLEMWPEVITDCQTCLDMDPKNMKAHYYLAQAQLKMRDFDGALASARTAHELCAKNEHDKSLAAITELVRTCRKERWDDKEKRRVREMGHLEQTVMRLFEKERAEDLAYLEDEGTEQDRKELNEEWEAKMQQMRDVFERARSNSEKKRKVPDWAVDDITFQFMVDPVTTLNGRSYERASIEEHLRTSNTDPLTRQHLERKDLRPNLNLKQACEEFLEENGWAADW